MSERLTSLQRRLVIAVVNWRGAYRSTAIAAVNIMLLFCAANIAAHSWLRYASRARPDPGRHFVKPEDMLRDSPQELLQLYPGLDTKQVQQRLRVPGVVSHPVLEFMQRPIRGPVYNVGTENLRATGFVSADTSTSVLSGAHWVFGGSTVFGHGVADDETLVHHLDKHDDGAPWINFAVQGYDQNLEIAKLILLLKKGYRPKSVLFFDGLNDIFGRLGSNYAPEESPMLPFSAYSYVYNVRALEGPSTFRRFLYAFPLVKLARYIATLARSEQVNILGGAEPIYSPDSLYHQDPRLHFAKTAAPYQNKGEQLQLYARRLEHYYRANLNQIAHLAQSYGFRAWVMYQPNGLLRPDSRFIVDAERYRKSLEYRVVHTLQASVREAITSGRLTGLIDLSQADLGTAGAYVDLAHYSHALNEALAKKILETRERKPPLGLEGRP